MRELTFGYSPCPNDTFAFHALTFGLIDTPVRIAPVLLDIEELNRRAHDGEFGLTKLSVGAFAAVGNGYRLLRSGAALGHGVGPLVVTRTPMSLADACIVRMAELHERHLVLTLDSDFAIYRKHGNTPLALSFIIPFALLAAAGVLMMGDTRLVSKPYGQTFIQSLPPFPRTRELDDVREFFAKVPA